MAFKCKMSDYIFNHFASCPFSRFEASSAIRVADRTDQPLVVVGAVKPTRKMKP
jgi:hypothetical protein